MRSRSARLLAALCAFAVLLPGAPASATQQPVSRRLVVETRDPHALSRALPAGARIVQHHDRTVVLELDARAAQQIAHTLAALSGVMSVTPDRRAYAATTPSDPRFHDQWGWHMARVPQVWGVTDGAQRVVVAVLDTGVDRSAADLRGARFTAGFDAVEEDRNPHDRNGHGTNTTGVIAAQHNESGSVGVCPGCSIMPVRVLSGNGGGWHSDIAQGLRWAADHGADIANLSLVSDASSRLLRRAVDYATARGVLVIGAAGNTAKPARTWPAAYPNVLGVAAHDPLGRRYRWSSFGNWVRLTAPGCNWSIGARPYCGTSSASPFIAGVAGLLMSADPHAPVAQVVATLTKGTRPAAYVRHGRVDARKALMVLPRVSSTAKLTLDSTRRRMQRARPVALQARALSVRRLPVPAAKLQVQQRAGGMRRFSPARNVVTNAAGRVRILVRPRRTTTYRIRVRGHALMSAGVTIRVR